MEKNMKVFKIKARAKNGNLRTVYAAVALDNTLADACVMDDIPMMSIISSSVTAPMTESDAIDYAIMKTLALRMNAGRNYVRGRLRVVS